MARSRTSKFDASEAITNELIRIIERGELPWRKPWTVGASTRPLHHNSEPYQGVNNFLLTMRTMMMEYTSPFWMTVPQANTLGAKIRKGEQSSVVVYYGQSLKQGEAAESTSGTPTGKSEADTNEISYPASLTADLKTERAMALGAAMTQHPEATLDLTLFKLVSDVLGGLSATHAIKVEARKEYRSHAKMDEIDSTSLEQVAAAHGALDLSWADEARSPADQFALFRALEADEKARLVAYATASTTQPCFARHRQSDSLMHDFEMEVMPDIRAHWTPNAALFNRFKKAWLLNMLSEDLGLAQEAVTLASSSKKEIVAFCDKLFSEPFATLTEAQHAAVAAWCPPMMQTTGDVPSDAGADDSDSSGAAEDDEPVQAEAA